MKSDLKADFHPEISFKFTLLTLFFFILLSIVVTWPTAIRLNDFAVYDLYTDACWKHGR
jgi:hypothetical protein